MELIKVDVGGMIIKPFLTTTRKLKTYDKKFGPYDGLRLIVNEIIFKTSLWLLSSWLFSSETTDCVFLQEFHCLLIPQWHNNCRVQPRWWVQLIAALKIVHVYPLYELAEQKSCINVGVSHSYYLLTDSLWTPDQGIQECWKLRRIQGKSQCRHLHNLKWVPPRTHTVHFKQVFATHSAL